MSTEASDIRAGHAIAVMMREHAERLEAQAAELRVQAAAVDPEAEEAAVARLSVL